jgi:hypothetical protein
MGSISEQLADGLEEAPHDDEGMRIPSDPDNDNEIDDPGRGDGHRSDSDSNDEVDDTYW